MRLARLAAVVTPSMPKPRITVSGVVIELPTGKPLLSVRSHVFAFAALPGGAGAMTQPPRPLSNDSVVPFGYVMSSTKAPTPWDAQSLAYAIETSTLWPAQADRSTR